MNEDHDQGDGGSRAVPQGPPPADVLNIEEAAEFLRLKVNTLYKWTSLHKIPFHKAGHRVLFFRDELSRWLRGSRG